MVWHGVAVSHPEWFVHFTVWHGVALSHPEWFVNFMVWHAVAVKRSIEATGLGPLYTHCALLVALLFLLSLLLFLLVGSVVPSSHIIGIVSHLERMYALQLSACKTVLGGGIAPFATGFLICSPCAVSFAGVTDSPNVCGTNSAALCCTNSAALVASAFRSFALPHFPSAETRPLWS